MVPSLYYKQVAALSQHVVELPDAGDKLCHHFDFGVYVRGAFYPAGTVVVGAIHLHPGTFVLAKGKMAISDPEGQNFVEAPYSCVTLPGTQRVLMALTDCVAYAILPTDETTVEGAEGTLAVNTIEEFIRVTGG